MKIKYSQVFGFEASIRGMRNPLNSHHLSDSVIIPSDIEYWDYQEKYQHSYASNENHEEFYLGEADKQLAQKLTKAGSEHCKFLRQIQVWVDLTLPRYIWSELDTYSHNTKNSESTMHTAHKRNLTQFDFENPVSEDILAVLNSLIDSRRDNLITSEEFIYGFKNNLPEGFLQKRTLNTNYAELLNIYKQRKNHRLYKQWGQICDWILSLPYFKELTGIEV
jgi:hypothetical protein